MQCEFVFMHRVLAAGSAMLNAGSAMANAGSAMLNTGSVTMNARKCNGDRINAGSAMIVSSKIVKYMHAARRDQDCECM
jgi:hypothetical protein